MFTMSKISKSSTNRNFIGRDRTFYVKALNWIILGINLCKRLSDEQYPKQMRFKINKASKIVARKEWNKISLQ